ncbi:ankyrin repeat domain-containing protein [Candidatus Sumerlaeota bacterium]|nr:ankyrin repeat domain-containing protein [Candidatus Sumerlaeota bacterium]
MRYSMVCWIVVGMIVFGAASVSSADEMIEGKSKDLYYYDKYIQETQTLIEQKDFEGLDRLFNDLLETREIYTSRNWHASTVFGKLSVFIDTEPKRRKSQQWVREWREKNPSSVAAIVLEGLVEIKLAWDARGAGVASTVKEERWPIFKEHLRKAESLFKEAETLNPECPMIYENWITVGMGLGYSKEELDQIVQKCFKILPLYPMVMNKYAYALEPKWGGMPGDIALMAARYTAQYKDAGGGFLYAYIATNRLTDTSEPHTIPFQRKYGFSWDQLKKSYLEWGLYNNERYQDRYGCYDFCWLACEYGDREQAAEIFKVLKRKPGDDNYHEFGDAGVFEEWKKWALDGGPIPDFKLHEACYRGDRAKVKQLIEQGYDINRRDRNNRTPFWAAVSDGYWQITADLVRAGADLNLDYNGFMPCYYGYRSSALMQALIDRGEELDFSAPSPQGYTFGYMCVINDNIDSLKMWLAHPSCDVNVHNGDKGERYTALHAAANKNNVAAVKLLLDAGADMTAYEIDGVSPLHFAITSNSNDAALLMINYPNAPLDHQNQSQYTPLHLAAMLRNEDTVAALLEKGANPNIKNIHNHTPFSLAVDENDAGIVRLFIEKSKSPDLNVETNERLTPLHHAVLHKNAEIVKLLLEAGAETEVHDTKGRTPLDIAKEMNDVKIIALFK